jgi:hypothetical protein
MDPTQPNLRRFTRPTLVTLFLIAAAAIMSVLARAQPSDGSTLTAGPQVTAPRGVRIKVQILNASKTSGLAARATRYLRDRGFDVVEAGNSRETLASTRVLDRSGKGDGARLIALALGIPGAQSSLDPATMVDVTVLLGSDWTPPASIFNP